MKLIYHPFSPYSRKVYILALELNLATSIQLEKVVVAPVHFPGWSDNVPDVSAAGNPLAKIPVLVVDDFPGDEGKPVGIFDSKFECEYLLARAGRDPATVKGKAERVRWLEKAVEGAADGITDAEILNIYEERLRKDKGLLYQAWIDGNRGKVQRGFEFLERIVNEEKDVFRPHKPDQDVNVAEIATAVACSFFDTRSYDWRSTSPGLAKWYEQWKTRESFVQTPPGLEDWVATPKSGGRL
jgi:glutathione S-transferase